MADFLVHAVVPSTELSLEDTAANAKGNRKKGAGKRASMSPLRSRGSPTPSVTSKIRSGSQQRETNSEVGAPPLPSRGAKKGRKCYATPALSGIPNAKRAEQNQKWSPTKKKKDWKWLPQLCLLRSRKEGGNATSTLYSRGSPTPSAESKIRSGPQQRGTKSEVATPPLPSREPKRARKCSVTPAFSAIPIAKSGEQNQ